MPGTSGEQPSISPNSNDQNTPNENQVPSAENSPVDLDEPGAEFGLDVRQNRNFY